MIERGNPQPVVGSDPRTASSARKTSRSQEIGTRSFHEEAVKHDRTEKPVVGRDASHEPGNEQSMLNEVFEKIESHIARARPGAVQLSRQARHTQEDTKRHEHTQPTATKQASAVPLSSPACSPGLKPLDSWAWNAIKREMFAVHDRIALQAETDVVLG